MNGTEHTSYIKILWRGEHKVEVPARSMSFYRGRALYAHDLALSNGWSIRPFFPSSALIQ